MIITDENARVLHLNIIDFCRARIAHLKCPRSVDFHPELPRHQTGKLYKGILKRPYWNS